MLSLALVEQVRLEAAKKLQTPKKAVRHGGDARKELPSEGKTPAETEATLSYAAAVVTMRNYQMSAANMTLKLGELESAVAVYEELQREELSAKQRAMVERKLRDARDALVEQRAAELEKANARKPRSSVIETSSVFGSGRLSVAPARRSGVQREEAILEAGGVEQLTRLGPFDLLPLDGAGAPHTSAVGLRSIGFELGQGRRV